MPRSRSSLHMDDLDLFSRSPRSLHKLIENEDFLIFMKLALVMHRTAYVEENINFFQLSHTDLGFKVKKSRVSDSHVPPISFRPVLLNTSCEVVV